MNCEAAVALLKEQLEAEELSEQDDDVRDPSYAPSRESDSSSDDNNEDDDAALSATKVNQNEDCNNPQPSTAREELEVEIESIEPPRKKKRLKTAAERQERDAMAHGLKEPCGATCKLGCKDKFTEDERTTINQQFWSLSLPERRAFVWSSVEHVMTTKHTTKGNSRRSKTYKYNLRKNISNTAGSNAKVCKVFYLSTLGFQPQSDGFVSRVMKSASSGSLSPGVDKRGRHTPSNKLNAEEIRTHIKSYNPAVHHYRREHAPNRLYLPSDVTITDMHADFCSTLRKISKESYRKQVVDMNISFAVLGNEECEKCKAFKVHTKDKPDDCSCDLCNNFTHHVTEKNYAREAYKKDAETALSNPDAETTFTSVDLQKVIMLPRLPGVKSCLFTKRIIAFNETFASLGQARNNTTVIWNEATAGRLAKDICSAYWSYFKEKERDTKNIILWADNCSAQNKNWLFFSFLTSAVNSEQIVAETIRMNYLVTGHTFMSADAVHSVIEREMRKKGDVCDWKDFTTVLENARCSIINMTATSFCDWIDGSNRQTISKSGMKLADMSVVEFRRGSTNVFFKKTHHPEEEFHEDVFLKKKFEVFKLPPALANPRGITSQKKADIIKSLCPLMPASRRSFWQNLPVNDMSTDLIENF